MSNDKCNQTRDAQKLAEVKVMELEQRFATAQKELKEAQDDKCKFNPSVPSMDHSDPVKNPSFENTVETGY